MCVHSWVYMCVHSWVYMCVHSWVRTCHKSACGGQDNSQEPVLTFHCMGPEDRTQVAKLGDSGLDALSHLASPIK